MLRDQDVSVLIAGAGPTGLLLACELRRRGVDCLVLEQEPALFSGARGKGLQPRSLEVLEDVGVLDQVLALGGLYPALRIHRADGVMDRRMDELHDPTPDVPYPNAWMLPQWRTGQLLAERLAELGGRIEFSSPVMDFEADADRVQVTLGGPDGTRRINAQYLIGADGGRSTVRKRLGVGFEGETRPDERTFIADVRVADLDRQYWHVWPHAADQPPALALCPLAGTDTFQLMMPAEADATGALDLAGLSSRVAAIAGLKVTDVVWSSLFRPNIRMVSQYRIGRVLLAGDAAHVHSPAGGQGLNTGVQDAYNLGWKLAATLAGAGPELLDSYEAERLPVAAGVLGISTRLHQKNVDGDPDALRRDDPALGQLSLTYRDGPLADDRRSAPGRLRAGDRAPDAPGRRSSGPVRLFDLFRRPSATLLAFDPDPALTAELERCFGDRIGVHAVVPVETGASDFGDVDGQAHRAYDIDPQQPALILVRPDGYVGLAVDLTAGPEAAVTAVSEYLDRIAGPAPVLGARAGAGLGGRYNER